MFGLLAGVCGGASLGDVRTRTPPCKRTGQIGEMLHRSCACVCRALASLGVPDYKKNQNLSSHQDIRDSDTLANQPMPTPTLQVRVAPRNAPAPARLSTKTYAREQGMNSEGKSATVRRNRGWRGCV